jgi:hypothetical protein
MFLQNNTTKLTSHYRISFIAASRTNAQTSLY